MFNWIKKIFGKKEIKPKVIKIEGCNIISKKDKFVVTADNGSLYTLHKDSTTGKCNCGRVKVSLSDGKLFIWKKGNVVKVID
jgi:hypothetical protein